MPGNHDLWLRGSEAQQFACDSFAKLMALRKASCRRAACGVVQSSCGAWLGVAGVQGCAAKTTAFIGVWAGCAGLWGRGLYASSRMWWWQVRQSPMPFAKMQMCDELEVDTAPAEVAPGLIVVPMLSWYNSAFDVADPG